MKKLERLLKKRTHIMFLDFEGTQFTHEMIAVGAVLVTLRSNGTIKRIKTPIKRLVKPKNKIGHIVEQLTGLDDVMVAKEGVSFRKALEDIKKYGGLTFKKCCFVAFGNHDLTILNQSIAYNMDYPKEICSMIQKNYIDFASFMNEFIRDDKNNPLSLVHACELFNVPLAGENHDPSVDALNLAHLYDAFLKNKMIVKQKYMTVLPRINHFPEPVVSILNKLNKGENVTPKDYDDYIREYLE